MRFELTLTVDREYGTQLPCNYMYELCSVIYKILNEGDPEFTAWLHDKGFTNEKKAFKLFTFSNLLIPCFKIEEDRLNILCDEIRLLVSFYPIEAIDAFVIGLFKDRRIELGDWKSKVVFHVGAVKRLPEPEFKETMRFRTLSPVFMDEKTEEGRPTRHLSPTDPQFAFLLNYNLLEKYRAFYKKEPSAEWRPLEVKVIGEPKMKVITIKNNTPQQTKLRAYNCQLEISGEIELLKLLYTSGAGRQNSMGFGMLGV